MEHFRNRFRLADELWLGLKLILMIGCYHVLKVDRIWPKVSHGTKSVRLVIETITKGGANDCTVMTVRSNSLSEKSDN